MTIISPEVVIFMLLKKLEYPLIFFTGGIVYMLLEVCWRGFSHWSMGICGGVCFLGIYILEEKAKKCSLPLKCLFGCLFITLNEFITGCIVNLLLGWNVWDYSHLPFNLLGQICLVFSLLWFLLSIVGFKIAAIIKSKIFSEKILD
ncbi:MAG: hypothetical protein E7574_02455 [Ruminococcaceae bacterium]|nr:hypothetical protein [Oscillospiraceae bacterium]